MRKIVLLAVLALVAVPAAFAEAPPGQASALCKQQRTAIGAQAFKLLYGGGSNAYGRCVSKLASTAEKNTANASKQCSAERADATFPTSHDGKTFDQFYGTGKHGNNAFGKCVSSKAKAQQDEQQQNTIEAAKTCKAERASLGAANFTKKYGGRSNAFGKCVSKTAHTTPERDPPAGRALSNRPSTPAEGRFTRPSVPLHFVCRGAEDNGSGLSTQGRRRRGVRASLRTSRP
jgi:hypothetical protein